MQGFIYKTNMIINFLKEIWRENLFIKWYFLSLFLILQSQNGLQFGHLNKALKEFRKKDHR